jgi:hypothetical protein
VKLHVSFDDPNHGWIGITVRTDDDPADAHSFTDSMSYTPFDSFWELVTALNLLAAGGNVAVAANWFSQPTRHEFRFARVEDVCSLQILTFTEFVHQPTARLTARGTFREICRPFWKALRDLQTRFPKDELERRWHRPFPHAELDRLTQRVRTMTC